MAAPRPPITHPGRSTAASTGMTAAETIWTSLIRMYQRLLRRELRLYQRTCASRRSQTGDAGGWGAAGPGLGAGRGWAIGVVVALIGPPDQMRRRRPEPGRAPCRGRRVRARRR